SPPLGSAAARPARGRQAGSKARRSAIGASCRLQRRAPQLAEKLENARRILLGRALRALDRGAKETLQHFGERDGGAAKEEEPRRIVLEEGNEVATKALRRARARGHLAVGETDPHQRGLDVETVRGGKEPLDRRAESFCRVRLARKQAVSVLVDLLRVHLIGPRETRAAQRVDQPPYRRVRNVERQDRRSAKAHQREHLSGAQARAPLAHE